MAIYSQIVSYVDNTQCKGCSIREGSKCEREPMEHSQHAASLDNNVIWISLTLWKDRWTPILRIKHQLSYFFCHSDNDWNERKKLVSYENNMPHLTGW